LAIFAGHYLVPASTIRPVLKGLAARISFLHVERYRFVVGSAQARERNMLLPFRKARYQMAANIGEIFVLLKLVDGHPGPPSTMVVVV